MVAPNRERTFRRLLRLVDLSGDLDRNRSDGEFREAEGNLLMVLDENIFEMFFRPSRHTEAVQTFYDCLWSDAPDRDRDKWRAFEAQSALLTAEILVGRGGKEADTPILLTEQHRFELVRRIEELATRSRAAMNSSRKPFRRVLAEKVAVMSDLEEGRIVRAEDMARELEAGSLGDDLATLRGVAGDNVVERFRCARVAADFLARDEMVEPLEQLRRAVASPIRSALGTVQTLFPASGPDKASIEADAERWYTRLVEELGRPAHRTRLRARERLTREQGPDGGNRRSVAVEIRNDARSLAHLRWIVRNRLARDQRLVFVTGDQVVFDAYRRWYLERAASDTEAPEPFFLRRAVQYSPMLNPVESGSDLHDASLGQPRKLLFNLIQQAVEASLIPIPGSSAADSRAGQHAFNAPRERLALKLVDCESIADDAELAQLAEVVSDRWLHERADELSRIVENWQRTQRFSIGASFDLVRQRLGVDLRRTAGDYFAATAQDSSSILNQYVTNVLDQLIDDSLQLWLPIAETFEVEDQAGGRSARRSRRITLAIDAALRRPERDTEGRARPDTVFAAAATMALEQEDVSTGLRFAQLAGRAEKVARSRGEAVPGRDLDFEYLQAVALRMQILAVSYHLRPSRSETKRRELVHRGALRVKTLNARASNLIEHCIAEHATEMDFASGDEARRASVLLLRALSERASLNLFTATSLGLGERAGQSPLLDDWRSYLELALGDLKRCVKMDTQTEEPDSILGTVRAQYLPNIAAYEVLAAVLSKEDRPKPQEWPRAAIRHVWDFWGGNRHIHPLLRAELAGFATLTGAKPPQGAPSDSRSHLQDHRDLSLPLDRELYRAIYRELDLPRARGTTGR